MKNLAMHMAWLTALALTGCGAGGEAKKQADTSARVEVKPAGEVTLEPGSPKLRQIRVAQVEVKEAASDEVRAPGKVELDPNRVSHLLMPVPGRVREVLVKLGDAVSEGQTLMTIESPEAVTADTAHRRSLAELRQAKSAQAKAEKDLSRIKDLYEHRAAALKDVSNAENDLVQAQAAVEQVQAQEEETRQRLEMLGLRPDGNPRSVAVRAPIQGKVLEIGVAPGEYRNDTAASLMTIADMSTVWITSNVPEAQIRLIQPGERVEVELSAYPGELIHGTVKRIADTVDPETRSVKVHAEMPNAAGRFRPEMFGRIHHSHGLRAMPVVPAAALVQEADGTFVYVEVKPGVFQRTRVSASEARDGVVPILSGLRGGERIVVDGAFQLKGN